VVLSKAVPVGAHHAARDVPREPLHINDVIQRIEGRGPVQPRRNGRVVIVPVRPRRRRVVLRCGVGAISLSLRRVDKTLHTNSKQHSACHAPSDVTARNRAMNVPAGHGSNGAHGSVFLIYHFVQERGTRGINLQCGIGGM
jgi:hypothetical protein